MIEVSNVQTEVTPLDVEVTASNSAEITTVEDGLDVTIAKKEYKIVGDEVYIAKLYDDAPQWMKDLVQLVVNNTVTESNLTLLNDVIEQMNQFATSYVPLNQYTQSILDLSSADASMHALIETLNSNFNDGLNQANAQIIGLENTKASKDEVIAQVLTTIAAQLNTPTSDLGVVIGNLQQAIVTGDTANASSIQTLMSSLEGEVDARATAINTINTYVGVNEAGASTGTGLSAYLVGSDGKVGSADSQVANGIAVTNGVATSKWAYNSNLIVNGVSYVSGFGLSNSTGTGIGSEFWIDATKLKFTNSATTGRTAPFTIDASGTTPQITFNGKVSFSNVTDVPQLGSTPQEVVTAINAGNTTTINGGKITTGTIQAPQIVANAITTDKIAANAITADKIKAGEITADKLAVIGLSTFTNDAGYTQFKTFMQAAQPTTVTSGDIWIDSDDNNKTYRYNGTTWDATTMDAAVAINTGTTTISGAKITTGSITADKINTTGLIAENISATTISGKTITGSTINTNSLIFTNDAGYAMKGLFLVDWVVTSTYNNNNLSTKITSNMYPYNSTNPSKYKFRSATSNTINFDSLESLVFIPTNLSDPFVFLCSTNGSITSLNLKVLCGSTVIAATVTWVDNTTVELGGIGFRMEYTGTIRKLSVRCSNANVSLSDTGSSNPVNISLSCLLNGTTDSYILSGQRFKSLISNL